MELNDMTVGKKEVYKEIRISDGEKRTFTIYDDGTLLAKSELDEPFKTFYLLSDEIRYSRDIQTKLAACEESYEILGKFVRAYLKDSPRLPPRILCRDVGVELYMRLGQWEKARIAIAKCAAAGAYTDGGSAALEYFKRYQWAAELALAFLKKNPGFLQKNIYRALPEADKECLKSFTRSSYLIRKEPCGKTNQLYCKENL